MQLKKGTTITNASGTVYTLTGLDIPNQIVKHTVEYPGKDAVPDEMSIREWKDLSASVDELEPADLVNKAPEPGNGKTTVQSPVKKKPIIIIGMKYRLADRSEWKITEYNRNQGKIVAVDTKSDKPQTWERDIFQDLIDTDHIKILSNS